MFKKTSLFQLIIVFGLVLPTLAAMLYGYFTADRGPFVDWYMININHTQLQGDAHLLEFPDGNVFMIDAGDVGSVLVPILKMHHVEKIDKILVSHMHRDHYSGIPAIIDSGIRIKEIYLNLPPHEICVKEIPWGCDEKNIAELIAKIKSAKIPIKSVKAGDIFLNDEGGRLEALYAFDGIHTPIGATDVNDMSTILRLTYGKTRVLFTGDLNQPIGEYLAKNSRELQADILKVPHHGGEKVAPNAFMDAVAPKVALVPAPKWLWNGDRCDRLRKYFNEKDIPVYVNGLKGTIRVKLFQNSYKIKTNYKWN